MPNGIPTNRTNITLPTAVSSQILQSTLDSSAIARLASKVVLPGNGLTIPMVTGDPEAAWVSETDPKPVSNPSLSTKIMQAYTLAVIVPFSNQFRRDWGALYDALIRRLPFALSKKFDQTVMGAGNKPGENFDNFANCTVQSLIPAGDATTYGGLVAAHTDIAEHGGNVDGFVLSPAMEGILLGATDNTGRPLFVNGVSESAIPRLLGAPAYKSRGAYKAGAAAVGTAPGTPALVGIAGDWTKAMYGVVEGVNISLSDQATLTIDSTLINLWERNMFAVRAEIEVGFRADTSCFNLLAGAVPSA